MLYLYGPGGIGKTTLLTRFADEARLGHRRVVVIRPGQHDRRVEMPGAGTRPPLVLIDDLDLADQPEQ